MSVSLPASAGWWPAFTLSLRAGFVNLGYERLEQRGVKTAVRPEARAHIHPKGSNLPDRLSNVVGMESAGEEHRAIDGLDDATAELPVMGPTGTPKRASGSIRSAGVQEQRVYKG